MTGQNSKKTISNTGKSRGTLCSAVSVSLIMQLTTQQGVYLLVRLSPSLLAFHRFILVAVRFFSAVTTHDTVLSLPKVQGYAPKCGFTHDRMNGLKFRGLHPIICTLFLPHKRHGALWCDKQTHLCVCSAQLILRA